MGTGETRNSLRQSLCLAQPRLVLRVRRAPSLVWLTLMTWGYYCQVGLPRGAGAALLPDYVRRPQQ
jgi:hypothetical protein